MKLLPLQSYKRVSYIIKNYGSDETFPQIANNEFSKEELIDYIGECEFLLENIAERRKKHVLPSVISILPLVIMSFFHNDIGSFFLAMLYGLVLVGIYYFIVNMSDNIKQTKTYDAIKEHYINQLLTRYEGK